MALDGKWWRVEVTPRTWRLMMGTDREKQEVIKAWMRERRMVSERVESPEGTMAFHIKDTYDAKRFWDAWARLYELNAPEMQPVEKTKEEAERDYIDELKHRAKQPDKKGETRGRDARRALDKLGIAYENSKGEMIRPKELKDKERMKHV